MTASGFFHDLDRHGDAPALVFPGGRCVTYADLARRVAAQATRYGARRTLVAVEARLSDHAVVAYLAALQGGHAVALLPPGKAGVADAFMREFRPEYVVRLRDGRWRTDETGAAADGDPPLHPDLALLLSTSGSTGQSRAVRLSAAAVQSNAASIGRYLGLTSADRGLLALPLHYSYGLSVLNSHLAAGASVLVQEKSVLDAGFVDDLRQGRCTTMAGVPYSYELLERVGFRDAALPDLRVMTVAGGRLDPALVRRYHLHMSRRGGRFFVMYGQTEATARIAYLPPEHLPAAADRIGIAIPGGALALVDESGAEIDGSGRAGELVYRGPNVMMGYAHGRADLARGPELTELRTGDLAERDPDGLYRIVGRLRRMSKIAGIRVGHDGLEAALAAAGVQGAVVGDDRTILAAYTSGQPVCEVRRLLVEASGLPAAHVRALALDALPRLPTGKVDYETLRGELLRPAEQAAGDVATLFRETFFPQAVGDGDTFVGLGGDSLRHVQVSIGLERALGHIPDGWETMPVRRLAALRRKETAGRGCEIGSDLVIRTLAALLVVVHHATLWPIPGGAAALMMLVGYSLARFQYDALVEGRFSRVLRPVGSLLVPYAALVVGFSVAWQQVPWASVFLVGNLGFADPDHHTMLPLAYWFVEAFVQLTLLWIGVMAIPPIRRFARRDPFGFGLGFLAAALAVRLAQPLVWDMDWRRIFTLHWNLYLAAFGWCAVFAVSLRQKWLLLAAAVVVMPLMAYTGGNWTSSWVKFLLQIPVLSVLLFAPRMRLPRRLFGLIVPFGVASYHIYLFHGLAPDLLRAAFGPDIAGPHVTVAVIATGVALGLVAHRVQENLLRALARLRAARRPVAGPSFAPAE